MLLNSKNANSYLFWKLVVIIIYKNRHNSCYRWRQHFQVCCCYVWWIDMWIHFFIYAMELFFIANERKRVVSVIAFRRNQFQSDWHVNFSTYNHVVGGLTVVKATGMLIFKPATMSWVAPRWWESFPLLFLFTQISLVSLLYS